MRETDFLGGFAKGLAVIEAFGKEKPRLSIAEVSHITGLDRATARRCLLTLAQLGYAEYDGKFFMLLPKILRLGHAYLSATPLPTIIQPHLDKLSDSVGESASASVLDGTEIVYIARASQLRVMSINLTAGSRLPAYCASMGRVLLAGLNDAEAYALLARTDLQSKTHHTLTDANQLMNELASIRTQGYAINDQELELGLRSIAVPIYNSRGVIVAALNVGAPAVRIEVRDLIEHILPGMQQTQRNLRAELH